MRKPKAPCSDCDSRTDHCHNETCPYGWLEYKMANDEYVALRNKIKRDTDYLAVTIGRPKRYRGKKGW